MNTLDTLKAILSQKHGIAPGTVSPKATLASLGLDAPAVAELVQDVQRIFQIRLQDDDEPAHGTVQRLVDLIDQQEALITL